VKSERSKSNSDEEDLQIISTFFTIKNNDVLLHDHQKGTTEKVYTVAHCFFPKVAFT
jgi:hypothetical protein